LFKAAGWLSHIHALHFLDLNRESVAIYADVLTFFVSAALISTLVLPGGRKGPRPPIDLGRTFQELKEGWRFIAGNPVVRSVMIGLGTGLIGGGMVVPLGPPFSTEVLHAGPAGFSLLQENVADEIRGRVFATLYTLIRLCLVIALAVAPLLAAVLNGISPGNVHVLGVTVRLPGVRLTLWLGSLIIVGAGLLAA